MSRLVHQLHSLQQAVRYYGIACPFFHPLKNEFSAPAGREHLLDCKGLYHPSNGFLSTIKADAGITSVPPAPKLLVLFNDKIQMYDQVTVRDVGDFVISGVDDIGGLHLCLDLSLEVLK